MHKLEAAPRELVTFTKRALFKTRTLFKTGWLLYARSAIVTVKVAHSSKRGHRRDMDGAEEPLAASGWSAERLRSMPEPPTPPRRPKTIFYEAPGGPLPDLYCNEVMPSTTSWPPVHKPWPFQTPSPPDGSKMPAGITPPVATLSPLPSSRDSNRVVGMPVTVERVSQHARPCRLSELEKLKERIDKLERTMRELGDRIEASSRKRPTQQQVNQPGSGGAINVSGGSIEGHAHFSFGDGATMNNYLLDRWIDECWPDMPSKAP